MSKIWSKIKKIYITLTKGEREISETRETEALLNREINTSPKASTGQVGCPTAERPASEVAPSVEQLSQGGQEAKGKDNLGIGADNIGSGTENQKTTLNNKMAFGASTGARSELVNSRNSIADPKILSRGEAKNLKKAVDVGGIEPPRHELTSSASQPATPTADPLYQEDLRSTNEIINKEVTASKIIISCPYCFSEDFVKRGTRQKKREKVQLYICKQCGRTFTPFSLKGKHYPLITILDAISYYNLGFSLDQVSTIMKEKQKIEIQPSTIATWYEEHKELCAYHRMRRFAIKEFSPYDVVETATLAHRQLYRFRYHRAKTKYIMEEDFKHYKFYPLKEFLELVPGECPHQYFQEGLRASEAPIKFSKVEMIVRAKENFATRFATLVLQGVKDNKQRHEILQKFMLANDSVTVATEVPVYIRREDLAHMQTQLGFEMYHLINPPQPSFKKEGEEANSSFSKGRLGLPAIALAKEGGILKNKKLRKDIDENYQALDPDEIPKLITGHIDFLQIRNGSIHILDYKDNAAKERPIEQLTLYALALSRLTGIRVFHFKCAWFDEKDYFEFFPLHVVYKPRRGRRKIYTKEGVYNLNEKISKIENLRPIA